MTKSTLINTPVSVTAIGFSRDMQSYPRRMEYNGTTYTFVDAGIRAVVRAGERIAQVFTISDGTHDFQLRSDNHGSCWTLVSMSR